MGAHVDVTNATFEAEVIKSKIPVLVDFWAVWCAPCKIIAPAIEQLAKEKESKLKVVKVDVDKNHEIAGKYGIRSIPTLLVFKNGEVVDQMIGAVPKSMIESKLQKHL